jgi:hypothetical protein
MHSMTFGRSVIIASLLCAPIAVMACADGDTILALNVTLKPTATSARTLAVTITQPGQSAVDTTVTIATKQTDAGTVLKSDKFFERITLPESYTEAEASVKVVAKDMAGAEVGSATAMVGVLPAEAVAGFVTIGEDPPPAMPADAAAK